MNCKIFGGLSAPRPNQHFQCYTGFGSDCRDQSLSYQVKQSGHYENSVPITYQHTQEDVKLYVDATGKRGSYCHRPTMGCKGGFLTYAGQRSERAVTMPSPSEGPMMSSAMQYNTQTSTSLFMPGLIKKLNTVADVTSQVSRFFYKHLHLSEHWKKNHLWLGDMEILTMDFRNCSHIDIYDQFPDLVETMVKELEQVLEIENEEEVPEKFLKEAAKAAQFVIDFKCPIPTSCCYQYVSMDGDSIESIKKHCYFINDGLSCAYKLVDHLTITFCGSVFQHNTAVPVYSEELEDGSVTIYVEEHPRLKLLAWGTNNNSGKKGSNTDVGTAIGTPPTRTKKRKRNARERRNARPKYNRGMLGNDDSECVIM